MGTYWSVAKSGDLSQWEELRHHEGARMRMGTGSTEISTVSKSSQTPSKPGGNASHGVNHPLNLYTFWCLSTLYLLLSLTLSIFLWLCLLHIYEYLQYPKIGIHVETSLSLIIKVQSDLKRTKKIKTEGGKSYWIHSIYFVDNLYSVIYIAEIAMLTVMNRTSY